MVSKTKPIPQKTAAENLNMFLKTSSYLALLPFYNYEQRKFISYKIFSYFCVLASIAMNSYSFYGKLKKFASMTSIVVLSNTSLVLTALVNNMTSIASTRKNLAKLQDIFDGFDHVDAKSSEFTSLKPPLVKTIKLQFYALHVFMLTSLCFDVYTWHFQLHSLAEYRFFVNDVIQSYLLANMTFVESNILSSIKHRYFLVNEALEGLDAWLVKVVDVGNNGESDLVGKIRCITRAHNKICDIVDLFNETFGWIILLMFLNIVISLLGCIDSLLHNNDMESANVILNVIWGVFVAIQGVLVASRCEIVMEEGKKTIAIAYKAMHRFSTATLVRDKLYILALQATARCPVFSAAGFFNIDFAMLFTFVNLITTYVIVIIQFSTPTT